MQIDGGWHKSNVKILAYQCVALIRYRKPFQLYVDIRKFFAKAAQYRRQ